MNLFSLFLRGQNRLWVWLIYQWQLRLLIGSVLVCWLAVPLVAQTKLYGLTAGGGSSGFGTMIGLDPQNPTSISAIFSFTGNPGYFPQYTDLTAYNGKLYGMTARGGLDNDGGVIFVLDPATPSSYSVLHSFDIDNGFLPTGSLTVYDNKLYGMASNGGSGGFGLIFSIQPDNPSSYTVLREFAGGVSDGKFPYGSLTVYNNKLYGMTYEGGSNDYGVIFSIEPGNPSSYTVLRSFAGNPSDGRSPYGSLTVYNDKLYGMTYAGGTTNDGVIFSIDPSSPFSYSVLRSFAGGTADGKRPYGSLTVYNNKLFGMTSGGGNGTNINGVGKGVIFSIDPTSPASYTVLKSFTDSEGITPLGSLLVNGSKLYGMTEFGGTGDNGVIFSINPDSPASYSVLKEFTGLDGRTPQGSLMVYNSRLYGMTNTGGNADGTGGGVIFSIEPDNPGSYTVRIRFNGGTTNGSSPYSSPTVYNNKLYGLAAGGGSNGYGVIFSIDPGTPGSFSVLRSFEGGTTDGSFPIGSLTEYNGKLYGMTNLGGSAGVGTIFAINPNVPGSYTVLRSFTGSTTDGSSPYGSLTVYNNRLYGMTALGGSGATGVIFSIDPDNPASYTILKHFTGGANDGRLPFGSLTVYNGRLYGMTTQGGSAGVGVIFSIDPGIPGSFTVVRHFLGATTDGSSPYGSLTVYNGRFYGLTSQGGNSVNSNGLSDGVLFSLDPTNPGSYTVLKEFGGSDGARPFGSLTVYDGKLYGQTQLGGSFNRGVIFALNGATQTFTKLADFTGPNGMNSVFGNSLTVFAPCTLSVSASASSATACTGTVVSLSALTTGGSSAATFSWQGSTSVTLGTPATTSLISATLNQSGVQTFTVTAIEGGCSAAATVSVTAVATPTSPTLTNSASQLTACAGRPVSLSVSCTVGQAEFSTSSNFASLTAAASVNSPTVPGSYTYHARCTNGGCSSSAVALMATVYANPATPNLTDNGPLTCSQTSATLTATSGLAGYSFSAGATPLSGVPYQATVTAQGIYSVVVSNSNGCTALASTTVTSSTAVPSLSINASSTLLSCTATTISLTAVGNGTLSWSTGTSATVISVIAAGDYSVTLTNGSGCSAVAQVTIGGSTSAPSLTLSPAAFTLTCNNPTVSLSAIGNGTVLWSTGATTPVLSVTEAGTYSVTLTGSNRCTATASAAISGTVLQAATVTADGSIGCGRSSAQVTIQAVGATSFTLLGPDNYGAVNTSGAFSVTAGGSYTGLAGQSGGCVLTGEVTVGSGGIPPSAIDFRASGVLGAGSCSVRLIGTGTGNAFVMTGPGVGSPSGYVYSNVYRNAGTYPIDSRDIRQPGTYTLTVYSGSCSATYTTVVTGTACSSGQ